MACVPSAIAAPTERPSAQSDGGERRGDEAELASWSEVGAPTGVSRTVNSPQTAALPRGVREWSSPWLSAAGRRRLIERMSSSDSKSASSVWLKATPRLEDHALEGLGDGRVELGAGDAADLGQRGLGADGAPVGVA